MIHAVIVQDMLNIDTETSIYENGFFRKKLENFDLTSLINNVKNIQTNSEDQILGYSTDIYDDLEGSSKVQLKKLADHLMSYKVIKKYLKFPCLLKIRVLKAKFNEEALKNPSRAMLWHRDLDDMFSQIKIILPLNVNKTNNGAFSVASKKIASRDTILIDKKLQNELELSNNTYRIVDKLKVSDSTFRKYYKDYIYEHEGDSTDLLFVDTNRCYHKGGQIIDKDLERHIIHFHIGTPTNIFHPIILSSKDNVLNYFYSIFAKSVRLFMKINFFLLNKKINSKKRILD